MEAINVINPDEITEAIPAIDVTVGDTQSQELKDFDTLIASAADPDNIEKHAASIASGDVSSVGIKMGQLLSDEEEAFTYDVADSMAADGVPADQVYKYVQGFTKVPAEERKETAIIEKASNNIVEEDITSWLANNPEAVEGFKKQVQATSILHRQALLSKADVEKMGVVETAGEWAARMVPLYEHVTERYAGNEHPQQFWAGADRLSQRAALEEMLQSATSAQEMDSIVKKIDSSFFIGVDGKPNYNWDKLAREQYWHDMLTVTEGSQWRYTASAVVDAVPLLGTGVATVVRGLSKAGKLTKAATAGLPLLERMRKGEKLEASVAGEALDVVHEPFADPSFTNNPGILNAGSSALSKEVVNRMMVNTALIDKAKKVTSLMDKDPLTDERAISVAQDEVKRFTKKNQPVAFNFVSTETNYDGTRKVVATIGKGSDGQQAFKTVKEANKFAENLGLKGVKEAADANASDLFSLTKSEAGYFIKFTKDAPDYTKASVEAGGKYVPNFWNKSIMRHITSELVRAVEESRISHFAVDKYAGLTDILNPVKRTVLSLKGKDADAFEELAKDSLHNEKWYTPDELSSMGHNDKVIAAYHANKAINDFAYVAANKEVRRQLVDGGFSKILKDGKASDAYYGKILTAEEIPSVPSEALWNFSYGGASATIPKGKFKSSVKAVVEEASLKKIEAIENKAEEAGRALTKAEQKKIDALSKDTLEQVEKYNNMDDKAVLQALLDEGHVLVQTSAYDPSNLKQPVRYQLIKRDRLVTREIDEFPVEYIAGGRRYYAAGTKFVKNATLVPFGDTKVLGFPKVLRAGTDIKELQQFVDEGNKIFKIYNDMSKGLMTVEDAEDAATALNPKYFTHTMEELDELVADGAIDTSHMLELVEDGEEMASYKQLSKQYQGVDSVAAMSQNSFQRLLAHARSQYGKRGEHLLNASGDTAPTVSAADALSKTLNSAIYTETFDEYKRVAAEMFVKKYGDVIDAEDFSKMTAADMLTKGRFKLMTDSNRRQIKDATVARRTFEMITMQPTAVDKTIESFMHATAKKLGDGPLGEKISALRRGNVGYDFISSFKPDKAAKAWAFIYHLGMYNPRQLWLQASASVQTVLLEPVHGFKGVMASMPVRAMLSTTNPETYKRFGKIASKLSGVSEKDIDGAVKFIQDAFKVPLSSAATKELVTGGERISVLDQGFFARSTIFYNEGERQNKISCAIAAYLKWKKKNPTKDLTEINDILEVSKYTDTLYMNMTKASETTLQRGDKLPTHLVAQFTSYPIRVAEAFLNNELSAAQKARLLVGNLLLTGVRGTVGKKQAVNMYRSFAEDPNQDFYDNNTKAAEWLQKGAVDMLLKEAGIPIQVGEDIGPKLYDAVLNDVFLGAFNDGVPLPVSAEALWKPAKAVSVLLETFVNPAKDEELPDLAEKFAKRAVADQLLPSSLSNLTKAVLLYNTNKLLNKKGAVLSDDVPTGAAVATALGFKTTQATEAIEAMLRSKAKGEDIQAIADDIIKLRNECIQSGKGWDTFEATRKLLFEGLSGFDRMKINDMVYNAKTNPIDKSLSSGYAMKYGIFSKDDAMLQLGKKEEE